MFVNSGNRINLDRKIQNIGKLERLWKEKELPEPIRKIYRNSIKKLPNEAAKSFVSTEVSLLASGNSLILLCLNSVLAREESIEMIKAVDKKLGFKKDWEFIEEIVEECSEILAAYRMITLDFVDRLFEWKTFMEKILNVKEVDIEYDGQKYLQKIFYDMLFLSQSQIGKVFKFSDKFDPFLRFPSSVVQGNTDKKYVVKNNKAQMVLPIQIYNRAKILEGLIENVYFEQETKDPPSEKIEKKKVLFEADYRINNEKLPINIYSRKNSRKRLAYEDSDSNIYEISDEIPLKSFISKQELIRSPLNNRIKLLKNVIKSEKSKRMPDKVNGSRIIKDLRRNHSSKDPKVRLDPIIPRTKLSQLQHVKHVKKPISRKISLSFSSQDSNLKAFIEKENSIYDVEIAENIFFSLFDLSFDHNFFSTLFDECIQEILEKQARIVTTQDKIDMILQLQIIENTYFIPEIYEKLIKEFANSQEVETIGKQVYQEAITILMAAALQEKPNKKKKGALIKYEFTADTVMNCKLQAIDEYEVNMPIILEEYFGLLPSVFQEFIPLPSFLITEANKGMNPSWYWFKSNSIVGLLVYSTSLSSTDKHCIIHHISCTNLEVFNSFITETEDFLSSESFKSVEFPSMSASFEKIIENKQLHSLSLIENNCFLISAHCEIELSEEKITSDEYSEDMIEVGIWHCIISELAKIKYNPSAISQYSRLQKEISDMSQIANSISGFEYPFENSRIDLKIRFPHSCLKINKKDYLRFTNISTKVSDDFSIYFIPTNFPDYTLLFFSSQTIYSDLKSELHSCKTDIFYKVEAILHSIQEEKVTDELLVPCFQKDYSQDCKWMEGFQVSDNTYIKSCKNFLNFALIDPHSKSGVLKSKSANNIISKDFIIGNNLHRNIP